VLPLLLAAWCLASTPSPSAEVASVQHGGAADPAAGSRWGFVWLGRLAIAPDVVAPSLGFGARFGLRERKPSFMFMPAIATAAGIELGAHALVHPWVELRLELMGARPGGLLVPAVHGVVSGGISVRPHVGEPLEGGVNIFRPYVGVGAGWNWWPGPQSNLTQAGALILSTVAPIIMAGRLELRLVPATNPRESSEVAVLVGVGI
jgi:hypothetical protein